MDALLGKPERPHKIGFAAKEVLKQLRGVSINSLFIGKAGLHDRTCEVNHVGTARTGGGYG